ncbi:NUDIX hydrolase [Catenulispora pinisilvae]|uniref:NUDIX hydrolase n=1 Tax=Catenulispora pinisilvae TaxID=2705253 RepID=UPI001890C951|nr:NUDIX domain-containing protein [Catenulispora pinisilvae]
MSLPAGPYARHAARVLLMNREDRLLLFKYRGRPGKRPGWLTPGGGIDEGETVNVAAARELREETGLIVAPEELGGLVAATGGYADFGWVTGDLREDFFFLRVDVLDIDISGFTEYEQKTVDEHRWWSVPELESTDENIAPWGLAPLLASILRDGPPEDLVELPWHH